MICLVIIELQFLNVSDRSCCWEQDTHRNLPLTTKIEGDNRLQVQQKRSVHGQSEKNWKWRNNDLFRERKQNKQSKPVILSKSEKIKRARKENKRSEPDMEKTNAWPRAWVSLALKTKNSDWQNDRRRTDRGTVGHPFGVPSTGTQHLSHIYIATKWIPSDAKVTRPRVSRKKGN